MKRLFINECFLAELLFETSNHVSDGQRLVASTEVDHLIAQRPQGGDGARHDIVDISKIPGL